MSKMSELDLDRQEAIAATIAAMLRDPKVVQVATANHLDNFTFWAAQTALHHLMDALDFNSDADCAFFNAVCAEGTVLINMNAKGNIWGPRPVDTVFRPSESKTIQDICAAVHHECTTTVSA